ncbi:phage tail assembly protein T [Andreprevotia chitinilytica]|uniref:phage tail assembly protein T n=1 Tax=Andreprevotia chitinilytica TaxID=396808 RepID=UPI00402BF0EC
MEPWDEERADLRAGIVASTLANCHRAEGIDPFTPLDFMPLAERDQPEPEAIDPNQAIRALIDHAALKGIQPNGQSGETHG